MPARYGCVLFWLAHKLATALQSARWPAVLPSIIDAAERDDNLAQLHAQLHADLVKPFLLAATRAQRRGDLPPDQSPADLVAAVIGPLFYRRWFSRETFDGQFIDTVVRTAVARHDRTEPLP